MIRTVNIITAVYIGEPTEYGYEKGKAYGLKLTQDDQFPIVLTGLREFSGEKDVTKKRLVYSTLNNMLGHWDEIRDTMGAFTEET
jgi:stress-induced morphogen